MLVVLQLLKIALLAIWSLTTRSTNVVVQTSEVGTPTMAFSVTLKGGKYACGYLGAYGALNGMNIHSCCFHLSALFKIFLAGFNLSASLVLSGYGYASELSLFIKNDASSSSPDYVCYQYGYTFVRHLLF